MESVLKDYCRLLFQLIQRKVRDVLTHESSSPGFGASLSNFAVDCCTCIGEGSLSCAHVLLEVFLEDFVLFELGSFFDLAFDGIGDEAGYFEALLLLDRLFFAADESSLEILWGFCVYFLKFFLGETLLFLDFAVFLPYLLLLIRESLLPGRFDEGEELVLVLVLLFRETGDAPPPEEGSSPGAHQERSNTSQLHCCI